MKIIYLFLYFEVISIYKDVQKMYEVWSSYTFNGSGVYVQWGWRMRPMGVAYTSKGAKVAYKSKGPMKH